MHESRHVEIVKQVIAKSTGVWEGDIMLAPPEEDMKRNTDLSFDLYAYRFRIGCRIRRCFYFCGQYKNEFTLRSHRFSGRKTELAKIVDGFGDLFFYGFAGVNVAASPTATPTPTTLRHWFLASLGVFRRWRLHEIARTGKEPGISKQNHDASSCFRVYSLTEMPPDFIIARGEFTELEWLPPVPNNAKAATLVQRFTYN